jgi:prenyltransferase beta subunit
MLRAARLAPSLLREAGPRVVEFLRGQLNDDGGGRDRRGRGDLYYTVFVLDGLTALGAAVDPAPTLAYVRGFGDGEGLDLVHLACLARCWAALPDGGLDAETATGILRRIGGEHGTVYDCFLALGAYQDLNCEPPHTDRIARCVEAAGSSDGAYGNTPGARHGTTTNTAAAVLVLHALGLSVAGTVAEWLLHRCDETGGFRAGPTAPTPDLLSTATALHALATLDVPLASIKERCLDYLDTLWTGRAFHGHWADEVEDAEYTFYGLLALGHLS